MVKKLSKNKRPGKAAAFNSNINHEIIGNKASGVSLVKVKKTNQHKARIKALEDEISLLTSVASDTVYRLNYDTMKYSYISPTVSNLLGYSTEEMKNINFRSLILQTRLITNGFKTVSSFADMKSARKKGDVHKWQADYLVQTKEGQEIWISDVSHPWFDETGQIIGSVGSLRDITSRVNAEIKAKEDLEKFANIDALTGISNRNEFFFELDRELKRINRSEEDVAMLLIDIDHFHKINSAYGSDIGDRVLIEISRVIRSCLRETDLLARLSGEEFGVLLPETTSQGAYWVAERIRGAILCTQMLLGTDQKPITCSVSIGIATASFDKAKDSSQMFKEADTRLYIAKNTGRNQVSVDEIMLTH